MFEKTTIDTCMDNNFTPCIMIDNFNKIHYCNRAALDATGFTMEEILAIHFDEIAVEICSDSSIIKIKNKEDNICQYFYRSVNLDEFKIILLQDDIYQLKSDLEKIFNAVAELVNYCGIYFLDANGKILSCNKAAQRISGYNKKEILGHNFSIFYPVEDLTLNVPQRHLQLTQVQGKYETRGIRVRKNGDKFVANVIMVTLYNLDGSPKGCLKLVEDLTVGLLNEKIDIENVGAKIMNAVNALDLINKKVNSRLEV